MRNFEIIIAVTSTLRDSILLKWKLTLKLETKRKIGYCGSFFLLGFALISAQAISRGIFTAGRIPPRRGWQTIPTRNTTALNFQNLKARKQDTLMEGAATYLANTRNTVHVWIVHENFIAHQFQICRLQNYQSKYFNLHPENGKFPVYIAY